MMAVAVLAWPQDNTALSPQQLAPQKIAAIVGSVDNPPFRGMHGNRNPTAPYRAWTPRLWDAIQPPASGGGFTAPATADNPPPRMLPPPTLLTSWEPELFIQLPDQAGATLPIQGDEPPRSAREHASRMALVVSQWPSENPRLTQQQSNPPKIAPTASDAPPTVGPLQRDAYNTIIRSWEEPFTYRRTLPTQIVGVDTPPPVRPSAPWVNATWEPLGFIQTANRKLTPPSVDIPPTVRPSAPWVQGTWEPRIFAQLAMNKGAVFARLIETDALRATVQIQARLQGTVTVSPRLTGRIEVEPAD